MGRLRAAPAIRPVSIGSLLLMLTTYGQQVAFLMQHDILARTGVCHECHTPISGDYKVKGNKRYWHCRACQLTTSLRYGTVLYRTKMKLNNFVFLAYCFTERNRTQGTSMFNSFFCNISYYCFFGLYFKIDCFSHERSLFTPGGIHD